MRNIFFLFLTLFSIAYAGHHEHHKKHDHFKLDFRLLEELSASASGQFNNDQFALILYKIMQVKDVHPSLIFVLDIRDDSHLFINGMPFNVHEVNKKNEEFYNATHEDEIEKTIKDFVNHGNIIAIESAPKEKRKKHEKNESNLMMTIQSEKEIAALYGVQYVRMPLSFSPEKIESELEKLMIFIKDLPQNAWVHVHNHSAHKTGFVTTLIEIMRFPQRCFCEILDNQAKSGVKVLKYLLHPEYKKNHHKKHHKNFHKLEKILESLKAIHKNLH